MMQREVADRISARFQYQGLRQFVDCGAVLHDHAAAFIVPRKVFVPAPNVDSAILKMVRESGQLLRRWTKFLVSIPALSTVGRLWNNLTSYFGKSEETKGKLTAALERVELFQVFGRNSEFMEFARLADAEV